MHIGASPAHTSSRRYESCPAPKGALMLTNVLRGAAALAVTCTFAVIAPAAGGLTIRAGEPELAGRVAITVPIVASCSAFDPAWTHISDSVSVSVQQASGNRIAFGSGFIFGSISASSLLFACD